MALPYCEGSVFLVPLGDGGFARGVVARAGPAGRVAFGYFFGPRLSDKAAADLEGLDPDAAIHKARFSDAALVAGDWPILGRLPGWDRSQWPMGAFFRRGGEREVRRIEYSEDDPRVQVSDRRVDSPAGLLTDYATRAATLLVALGAKLQSDRGPPLPRTPRPKPIPPNRAHAVIVFLPLSTDPDVRHQQMDESWDMQEEFERLLWEQDAGVVDGDEWGKDGKGGYNCLIFMYGSDARHIWRVIEPVLKASPFSGVGYADLRFGDHEGALKERVTWS